MFKILLLLVVVLTIVYTHRIKIDASYGSDNDSINILFKHLHCINSGRAVQKRVSNVSCLEGSTTFYCLALHFVSVHKMFMSSSLTS